MIITKEQIIKAIMTEPLAPNRWFHVSYDDEHNVINAASCPVCAVGAVLRNGCKVEPDSAGTFYTNGRSVCVVDVLNGALPTEYSQMDSVYEALFNSKGNWLNKLSVVFESMCSRLPGRHIHGTKLLTGLELEAVRLELADYVKDEFPRTIEVAI